MTGNNNHKTDLPPGWVECLLSDFCELIMGQSPPSSTYNTSKIGIPFYQGKSEFGEFYPTPEKYCDTPVKIAEEGDILISVRAPVGPTNIAPHKACIGRGLAAIRPMNGIPIKFVLYLFRYYEPAISKQGTGTTFKAITKDFLKNLEFPLPPRRTTPHRRQNRRTVQRPGQRRSRPKTGAGTTAHLPPGRAEIRL